MDIYERYGRKTEQLEQAIEAHLRTLGLLRAIKNGEVDINRVVIEESGWHLETPPTSNKELEGLAKGV